MLLNMGDVGGWVVSPAPYSTLFYQFPHLRTVTPVLSSGSTSTCASFSLSSPYSAHSCAQDTPQRKRGTPIEGVVLLFRIIATYLLRPKPVAMTLIWRSWRNLDEFSNDWEDELFGALSAAGRTMEHRHNYWVFKNLLARLVLTFNPLVPPPPDPIDPPRWLPRLLCH